MYLDAECRKVVWFKSKRTQTASQNHRMREEQRMASIAFNENPIKVDLSSYLSSHDIVYLSSPMEGYEGFPLGNGDLGAMIWCKKSGIEIQINKIDMWDQPDEERDMILRSCGRLTIEEAAPSFDWLYLDDFEARLSLYKAMAMFSATTPFLKTSADLFIPASRNVLIVKYDVKGRGDLAEGGSSIRIGLERWGSRAFPGWYNRMMRGAHIGLGNTTSGTNKNDIHIEDSLNGLKFAMVCRVIENKTIGTVANRHRVEINLTAKPMQEFVLMLAVVTENESPDPKAEAMRMVEEASTTSRSKHMGEHVGFWHEGNETF